MADPKKDSKSGADSKKSGSGEVGHKELETSLGLAKELVESLKKDVSTLGNDIAKTQAHQSLEAVEAVVPKLLMAIDAAK